MSQFSMLQNWAQSNINHEYKNLTALYGQTLRMLYPFSIITVFSGL